MKSWEKMKMETWNHNQLRLKDMSRKPAETRKRITVMAR